MEQITAFYKYFFFIFINFFFFLIHILQTVMPDAKAEIKACDQIWHKGKDYETYMAYVTCVKITLGK